MTGAADWVFTFSGAFVPLITGQGGPIPLSIPLCNDHYQVGVDMAAGLKLPFEAKRVDGKERDCFECRLSAALATTKPAADPAGKKVRRTGGDPVPDEVEN